MSHIQAKEATVKDATELNKVLKIAKDKNKGITFPNLDMNTVRIRDYADAGFAANEFQTSQLGTVIVLIDEKIMHIYIYIYIYILNSASWKSRRVVLSPLAAEVYASTAYHDYCFTLAHELNRILGRKISIYLLTDSKSIFNTITKLTNFSEKPLVMILLLSDNRANPENLKTSDIFVESLNLLN